MGVIDNIVNAGQEIISRPSHVPGGKGQADPGVLTNNVGSKDLLLGESMINISKPKNISPLDSVITSGDANRPISLYANHADDINLANNDILTIDELTPNIGSNIGNSFNQDNPGILTPNINDIILDTPLFNQDVAGVPTTNIGNSLNNAFIQDNAGVLTPNIGTTLAPSYNQDNAGFLTNNVGANIGNSFIQDNAGMLTNNVGDNDLDLPLIIQYNPGILTPNIGNNIGESFIQDNAGILTNNIGDNDLDLNLIIQDDAGVLSKNIGNDLKESYKQEIDRNNIGTDLGKEENPIINENTIKLNQLFENISKQKNIVLPEQYKQPEKDIKSINDINNPIYNNETTNDNIGNDLKNNYTNPENKIETPKDEIVFENKTIDRKVELDSITLQMKNRKNIGLDLGKLF